MRKLLCRLVPAILFAALPAAAFGGTSVDSTTVLRFEQDAQSRVLGTNQKTFAPLIEFLGIDSDGLGDGNLSLRLYGWGRVDLADRNTVLDSSDRTVVGHLTYGFLQYRFDNANARIRAGRIFINEGIVNEQIDGVSARTDLPYGFGISTFGGANVHTAKFTGTDTDGKGDGIVGGRFNYRLGGRLELGVSGLYESKAPTPAVAPALAGGFGNHRLVGGDIWLKPIGMAQVSGHSSYNTETRKFAEHSYLLQVTPLNSLVVSATFDQHHDRDYFYSSFMFSELLKSLTQQSRVLGGSAVYTVNKHLELNGDYKDYRRDSGKADRFGGEVRGLFADNTVRTGLGYHYLRSNSDFAVVPIASASASFHEVRAFAMRDSKSYFASLDLIGYLFRKRIENKESAWEAQGSLGYHLSPDLALSGDLSYGQNPQYNDEVKGLIRLTYNMKGATK